MRKLYLLAGIALFTVSKAQTDTIKEIRLFLQNHLFLTRQQVWNPNPNFSRRNGLKINRSEYFICSFRCYMGQKEQIRENRNRYLPNFKVPYDDYLQYTPALAVYGLKLAGVKGRNNIGRATLSYATSLAIMAILVNSIKYTAKVERPDGSKEILSLRGMLQWLSPMQHF